MSALQRPLTYDDLFDMPEDGMRREVIGGELFANPAPRRDHQDVSVRLTWILLQFLRREELGWMYTHPVDLYVGPNDVVQPDLIVIREERLDIYRPEGMVVEPPDIVIEIISPSSQRTDLVAKMALYARFGVTEYWIVDPDQRTLVVNVLNDRVYEQVAPGADGTVASRVFPGLVVDPADVFSSLDG